MAESKHTPRVVDNDRDEITITLDGKEIRGWSYSSETERRTKMLAAREFCEGWFQGRELLDAAATGMLEALILARTVIHEDRDVLFDSVTVAGDASTMDDTDRPHVERLDVALAVIDAAIARAEGRQDGGE